MYAVNEWFPGALTETLVAVDTKDEARDIARNLANTYSGKASDHQQTLAVREHEDTFRVYEGKITLAEYSVSEID